MPDPPEHSMIPAREGADMNAVIELKGKQYRIEEGMVIRTLRIEGDPGSKISADRVLATIDGDNFSIGTPLVDGAGVELEIVRQARSPKIHIWRYQSKKRMYKRRGYRDDITYLRVTKVGG
jgi:large subunit ribosomal protein L21